MGQMTSWSWSQAYFPAIAQNILVQQHSKVFSSAYQTSDWDLNPAPTTLPSLGSAHPCDPINWASPTRSYGEQLTAPKDPSPGGYFTACFRRKDRETRKTKRRQALLLPQEKQPSNLHTIKHKTRRQCPAKWGFPAALQGWWCTAPL